MAHIDLGSDLPGVTGLLEYRQDTGDLLRELTQLLLRGPSTLTEAERPGSSLQGSSLSTFLTSGQAGHLTERL